MQLGTGTNTHDILEGSKFHGEQAKVSRITFRGFYFQDSQLR